MSYRPVVVTLRRTPEVDLDQQLAQIMRPFLYDPDATPPSAGPIEDPAPRSSWCDGWRIGGYWSGRYLSTATDRPELVNPLHFPDNSPLAGYVACDGGPKHLLDLEYARAAAERKAWRRWPAFLAERRGIHGGLTPSTEQPSATARADLDEYVAQERGHAVTATALVTVDGEWLEGERGSVMSGEYLRRAGDYIAGLDDDCWLVCLMIHD